ncbi:hypothetical protein AYO38_08045 [bacterium SCGC AG-212-C10]|nr:hypothetical protein AYO38_08045 [bacterium SCGC AG-212-C10]
MDADYDDAYPTCEGTHATVRMYHDADSPDDVTRALGVEPSQMQRSDGRVPSAWLLQSEDEVTSRDLRRHIDWILARLSHCASRDFDLLFSHGWTGDVSCFWVSKSGHGGPTLNPVQMARLGALGLRVSFDIYGAEPHDRPLDRGELTSDFNRARRHWFRRH